jgi:Flp pilus assembly protein TadD
MVGGRRIQTQDAIDTVGPLAIKEKEAEQREVAALEGGVIRGTPAKPLQNGGLTPAPVPPAHPAESLDSRRIAELEKRVQELQSELASKPETTPAPGGSSREQDRSRDIAKQRDTARADLKRAQDEMAQLRAKFAAAPVQEEMQKLTDRIGSLEREKAATGQALNKSQEETRAAKADVAALQTERARLRQAESDLKRNLDLERKNMSDVVAGQQKQLREYQEQLRASNDREARANQKIAGLEETLRQVRQSFDDLKLDRDNLLRERDQMAQLLQQDEGKRIQSLIDQNMGLAKELREAGEKLNRLNQDNNTNQDSLIEATRDLAIAKQNINDLKREKFAQDQRLQELEKRLRNEDQSLAEGKGDPEEVQALREMIQKQLRVQERRREANQVLLDAVAEKAKDDEKIKEAVDFVNKADEMMPMTPEELALIDRKVDDAFVSPVRRTQGEVDVAVERLERENMPYADAAKRAFLNGRLEACRELYGTMLERNPGDTETRCKLGLVQIRLRDFAAAAEIFRRAAELDTTNPYAFRMLGLALSETGERGEAIKALEESVKLAPTNSDGRILLGSLYFDVGQDNEAEEQFKSAIAYEDTTPYPHMNLAQLYAKQGKKEKGLQYYRNALERGASTNLDLEKRLTVTK